MVMKEVVKYIECSKTNIDNFIRKHEYRKAFALFILVLDRLNDTEKKQVIYYYSQNLAKLGILQ